MDPPPEEWIALARDAVRAAVLGVPPPEPRRRSAPRPVFVTLERDAKVLGCRGALTTRRASVEEEIRDAARAAALFDPRSGRRRPGDLDGLQVTVTVVDRREPLADIATLRPDDGLVLEVGARTGVVLPWEGRDPRTRLRWAALKAGVAPGTPAVLSRLVARRWRG